MGKMYQQLSLEERCTIARLREAGQSIRQIAAALDRSASTISRELARNVTYSKQDYRPVHADDQAWARRWRGSKLERHPDLQHAVLDLLAMGWSPEQVASRMALEERSIRVSTETIYRFIYAQYARHKDGRWRLYLPRAKFRRGYRGRRGGALKQVKERVRFTSARQKPNGARPSGIGKVICSCLATRNTACWCYRSASRAMPS